MLEGGTIGAYRIVHKLGQGGMGTVYLGEHTLLERKAAIKVLLPSLCADEDIVKRFFNEARAVTRIADAGIVQVFDFGVHSDGSAFIVMELLEGEAMDRRLARVGRFGCMECLRLMQQICMSLAVAHAKGVVHRDLKPENIFLVGDAAVAGGERTKILDFGIAKLSGANDKSVLKTQTGTMIGTPVYMSPEQCRGAGEIDHRADIYTIGCVMCTMLTGTPPFDYAAPGELVAAHLMEDPPLMSSRVEDLPDVIEQIIQKCLCKDPDERFQTMAELAEALAEAEDAMSPSSAASTSIGLGAAPYVASGPTTMSRASGHAIAATPPARSKKIWIVAAMGGAILAAGVWLAVLRTSGRSTVAPSSTSAGAAIAPVRVEHVAPPIDPAPIDPPPIEQTVMRPAAAPIPVQVPPPAPIKPKKAPPPAVHSRGGAHGSGSTAGSAAFDRSD